MASSSELAAPARLRARLARIRNSNLIAQNLVLFAGGLVAGVCGFVYHAIAARRLGASYIEVAALVAVFAVAMAPTYVLILVLARYAATLRARDNLQGVHNLMFRTTRVILPPSLAGLVVMLLVAIPGQGFIHLSSYVPMIWLCLAIVVIWQVAVPRGILQGLQRFPALSLNLSSELVVRTAALAVLLAVGLGVTGSMVALLAGATTAYVLGVVTLRDVVGTHDSAIRLRTMATFSLTAAAGTIGVLLLYNVDVILAAHYLPKADGSIYGALNKIETIIYFLTLSVSQVMFPRVVDAIQRSHHPGRLLLLSAGIMCAMGACALVVFGVVPKLFVSLLFGPRFLAAAPFMLEVGVIGLALSLDNLMIQFFMAAHDRAFVPFLAAGCLLQVTLIFFFHHTVGTVVNDVLIAFVLLLGALGLRAFLLMPKLRPEMVVEEPAVA